MVEPDKIQYKKGSLAYNLMVDDWSDLTTVQIAEVLDCTDSSIRYAIQRIRERTGYCVPHKKGRLRLTDLCFDRKKTKHDAIPFSVGSIAYTLMRYDWSDMTAAQIGATLGYTPKIIRSTIWNIRIKTGYCVPYVKLDRCGKPLKQLEEENS